MLVTDLINRRIATIDEHDSLEQACRIMSLEELEWLVVTNRENRVAGLLYWGDIRDLPPRQRKKREVSELMLTGLVLADRKALEGEDAGGSPLVEGYATPFMPVVVLDGEAIVGIISAPGEARGTSPLYS